MRFPRARSVRRCSALPRASPREASRLSVQARRAAANPQPRLPRAGPTRRCSDLPLAPPARETPRVREAGSVAGLSAQLGSFSRLVLAGADDAPGRLRSVQGQSAAENPLPGLPRDGPAQRCPDLPLAPPAREPPRVREAGPMMRLPVRWKSFSRQPGSAQDRCATSVGPERSAGGFRELPPWEPGSMWRHRWLAATRAAVPGTPRGRPRSRPG